MICRLCIDRLEEQTCSPADSDPTVSSEELPVATSTSSDPIHNCAWDDVIVSTSMTNMAQRQKKGEQMKSNNSTRLQGFRVNGVLLPSAHLSKDVMRKWAISKGRSKARGLSKQQLCEAIVEWKARRKTRRGALLDERDLNWLRR